MKALGALRLLCQARHLFMDGGYGQPEVAIPFQHSGGNGSQ